MRTCRSSLTSEKVGILTMRIRFLRLDWYVMVYLLYLQIDRTLALRSQSSRGRDRKQYTGIKGKNNAIIMNLKTNIQAQSTKSRYEEIDRSLGSAP